MTSMTLIRFPLCAEKKKSKEGGRALLRKAAVLSVPARPAKPARPASQLRQPGHASHASQASQAAASQIDLQSPLVPRCARRTLLTDVLLGSRFAALLAVLFAARLGWVLGARLGSTRLGSEALRQVLGSALLCSAPQLHSAPLGSALPRSGCSAPLCSALLQSSPRLRSAPLCSARAHSALMLRLAVLGSHAPLCPARHRSATRLRSGPLGAALLPSSTLPRSTPRLHSAPLGPARPRSAPLDPARLPRLRSAPLGTARHRSAPLGAARHRSAHRLRSAPLCSVLLCSDVHTPGLVCAKWAARHQPPRRLSLTVLWISRHNRVLPGECGCLGPRPEG